ncbi:MAG: ATP-binding cassette domain-containing protein [Eubacteriales bacterium]|nr:ATP-binding cassette domain-containing protein [Eubacteriales bacterium]
MSLIVKNLTKSYGEKIVVDHLSFSMSEPGVYALLGTNGAGKTTSIRMMLGMLARDEGEVLWKGKPLTTASCNVGYLAEERGLYPKYRLMDQLVYFAHLRGVSKAEAEKRVRYWAERLHAEEYLYPTKITRSFGGMQRMSSGPSMKADQLSKGNQQKIQLMTALISDPELLILDEPLSGLDPVNTDLFKSIIREEIEAGKYLIMSSHQMATVEEFCSEITIMDRAKAVLQGNLNEIKKSYGRVNLRLKTEGDATECIRRSGAAIVQQKENEYVCKVTGEGQANALLRTLIERQIPVVTFDLREPSLHEIFVEKAGEHDE